MLAIGFGISAEESKSTCPYVTNQRAHDQLILFMDGDLFSREFKQDLFERGCTLEEINQLEAGK